MNVDYSSILSCNTDKCRAGVWPRVTYTCKLLWTVTNTENYANVEEFFFAGTLTLTEQYIEFVNRDHFEREKNLKLQEMLF